MTSTSITFYSRYITTKIKTFSKLVNVSLRYEQEIPDFPEEKIKKQENQMVGVILWQKPGN